MPTSTMQIQNYVTPDPGEDVAESLFQQYEKVIVESIVVSFGLDFLLFHGQDKHGGDVDTIHNVRQIGTDPEMTYKNVLNQQAYENRGEYSSREYHQHKAYKAKNKAVSETKKAGELVDGYTGEKVARNSKTDLDHVISAKEIHDDRGRVLAGLNGPDLANSDENLVATNPHTNRSKKADTMDEYLEKHGDEYTEEQKRNMHHKDAASRKEYETKLQIAYYTSPGFAGDVAKAAGRVGASMGLRQVLGFAFMEVWFAVKEEFQKAQKENPFNMEKFLNAVGSGVQRGVKNAQEKYREMFSRFASGAVGGALSSITTSLCNIFFTTAKNTVKIIRQSWASLVEAVKILLINPDGLYFGERFRAAAKIIATGASIVVGNLVDDVVSKTAVAAIPVVGPIVQTFCGIFTTGTMSCTLLYFLDRSALMNGLVEKLNRVRMADELLADLKKQAAALDQYAAELMRIDVDKFRRETQLYSTIADDLTHAGNEEELNRALKAAYFKLGINLPWQGDFRSFLADKTQHLVYE